MVVTASCFGAAFLLGSLVKVDETMDLTNLGQMFAKRGGKIFSNQDISYPL